MSKQIKLYTILALFLAMGTMGFGQQTVEVPSSTGGSLVVKALLRLLLDLFLFLEIMVTTTCLHQQLVLMQQV